MKTRRREPPGHEGDKPGPKQRSGKPDRRPGSTPDTRKPGEARRAEEQKPQGRSVGGRAKVRQAGGPRRRDKAPDASAPLTLARTGRELLYGRNAVMEAMRSRRGVERLFLAEGIREDERLRALIALAEERKVEVDRVPRMMLDDATRGANHQGVALEAEPFRYTAFEELVEIPGTVLVLDHLQDPQNVGTLFRAAEAAGVAGVVIPQDRAAAVTPAVVNASAGAIEHLRVAQVPNLARALTALKGSGRWVAGLDAGPDATDIFSTGIPLPAAIVVGAEGGGLSANMRKQCDVLLAIPMRGRVASLNAATAGSIALYEIWRQEREGPHPLPPLHAQRAPGWERG